MSRLLRVASVGLVLLVGCQSRLKYERAFAVGPGDSNKSIIDGPKYDQKVTVTLTTTGPVDLDVYLAKDAVQDGKPKTLLGSLTQSSGGQLDVQVPAKQEFIVEVSNARKEAKCTVKVEGK
ncbi:MAG: hypothetical protein U0746_07385 [Gemmataceae bacterium]